MLALLVLPLLDIGVTGYLGCKFRGAFLPLSSSLNLWCSSVGVLGAHARRRVSGVVAIVGAREWQGGDGVLLRSGLK